MEPDVRELLNFIDVNGCDYRKWITVGMAVHSVDPSSAGLRLWDEWSSRDRRVSRDGSPMYKPYGAQSCAEKWKSFSGSGVTKATLIKFAKDGGWRTKGFSYAKENDYPLPENAMINEPEGFVPERTPENAEAPSKQLARYIETMFEPSEYVGYVTSSARLTGGRWAPDRGVFTRTAKEILEALEKSGGDLKKAVGPWHEECGAWIRINPLGGKGVKDSDVTALRYALIESDSEPIAVQREVYTRLRLPIACLVSSGGKSLHAVVKVDAKNLSEYRQRVDYLYGVLEREGLKPDHADRNPARLSRMPGVTRNGALQKLEGTNLGLKDFSEWKYFVETGKSPPRLRRPAAAREKPPKPPALIEGILQYGHKMLIV
ncbi:MAG: PriCT-2 domain-containing protein, partial [Clostridia bacterium]|nr:PriCT-2 domain-containing protein [Clostridia bacterium]